MVRFGTVETVFSCIVGAWAIAGLAFVIVGSIVGARRERRRLYEATHWTPRDEVAVSLHGRVTVRCARCTWAFGTTREQAHSDLKAHYVQAHPDVNVGDWA